MEEIYLFRRGYIAGGEFGAGVWYAWQMLISEDEESKLVRRLLAGEPGAARKLYEVYSSKMNGFVKKRTKSVEDAEEIVQDVFMTTLESLPLYSGKSRLFGWMCGIAKHEIADYYRKKRLKTLVLSHVPVLEQWLSDGKTVEGQFAKEEMRLKIEAVLGQLFPRYAQVLRMKYLEGWSVQEMADELGESLKATETALFRARKAFALVWSEISYEGEK